MTTNRHPETGFHYVHVLAKVPTFSEIWNSYEAFASRCPWMSVIEAGNFESLKASAAYQDPDLFIVSWVHSHAGPREKRKAKVACLYAEALGRRENMLPDHRARWDEWSARAAEYDMVLGHTPFVSGWLMKLGVPAGVYPVGWDPAAVRGPDWSRERKAEFVYYGSQVGNRLWTIPALKNALGDRLRDVTGHFGEWLDGSLRFAMANLYIAHSDVKTFSTWRIWQSLPAGAPLVGEESDIWPLENNESYMTIPAVTPENVETVAGRLRSILEAPSELLRIAKNAWEDVAQKYTVEKCMGNYMVPASMRLR